jgi:hypothetical protein
MHLHVKVNLPIVVKTNKSENASTGFRTQHVDTRYHFVREFIEDGFIKIEFVRSVKNDSDLFTKNVKQEVYANHTKKFLEDSEVHSTGYPLHQPFSFTRLGIIH